jgi:hypothetical protein
MHLYHNLGGSPGDDVVLQEQTDGSNCAKIYGNPPTCSVAGIPADRLEGVHDVAALDIDGDGRKDLVVGRCSGTQVYINHAASAGGLAVHLGPLAQLRLGKHGSVLSMSWGASCASGDDDYAIYQGQLQNIGTHVPATCSTAGLKTHSLPMPPGNTYYLVVPNTGRVEGSYGTTSAGQERAQGSPACLPRLVGPCG